MVVDENGNEIQRDRVTSGSLNSSGKVPNYEIYAVSTTYYSFQHIGLGAITAARVNSMSTKLTYGTAIKASKLVQTYYERPELGGFSDAERSKTVNSPAAGTLYQYNPNTSFRRTGIIGTYIGTTATVYCGSEQVTLRTQFDLGLSID